MPQSAMKNIYPNKRVLLRIAAEEKLLRLIHRCDEAVRIEKAVVHLRFKAMVAAGVWQHVPAN
jgi:hypothetical protein